MATRAIQTAKQTGKKFFSSLSVYKDLKSVMNQIKLNSSCFHYSLNGHISIGDFPLHQELYTKVSYEYGPDWQLTSGAEESMTQISLKSSDDRQLFVWNFPLNCSWKATNIYGWPRIVFSLYGPDFQGRDVVCGYGSCLLPINSGTVTKKVAIYAPKASSAIKHWGGILSGRRPELVDPKTVARNQGRDVTRMTTQGYVTAEFHTILKDFCSLGYDYGN